MPLYRTAHSLRTPQTSGQFFFPCIKFTFVSLKSPPSHGSKILEVRGTKMKKSQKNYELNAGESFRLDKNGLHGVTAQGRFKMSLLLVLE